VEDSVRVLHIEDDAEFADLTATFLERQEGQFSIEHAKNAEAALDLLRDTPPDCIVSDYDMPGMNGIDLLKTVREEFSDLPFILFTGKGSEEIASEAISAGVTDYLQKDSGTEQYAILANRIGNAVSAYRSAIEAEQNRHQLEQTLKTVPSCVVRLDYEGQFVFANDRAVEVLGLEKAALTDRTYNDPEWEITDLDGNPIPDEQLPFRRVRDSGEPLYGFRHTITWPDGTQKILLVNGAPVSDSDGETDSVIFSLTDVTEEVEHEQRLAQTTARLEALFENSPDMINVHDMEGNITDPNPTLCEETGYDEAELTEMKVWELDRAIDPEEARALWERMDHDDRERLEGLYRRRDGSDFPVEVHIRRLDVSGRDRFIVISRKISD
jgi:PAS domain S-box-containing protein